MTAFNRQPTLNGNLIELRPLQEGDWTELYGVASDPLIWELHPERERYKEEIFRMFFRKAMESGSAFAVIDRSTGHIIGSSRYHDYILEDGSTSTDSIEIGWSFLARSHWGGVYNREVKQLLMQHAFQHVERVLLVIGVTNYRSQRATEKIEGQRIGQRLDDTGKESVVYEITKAIFEKTFTPS